MALRFTPRDDRFYDMFAKAAGHLIVGAKLLGELIDAAPVDRPAIAARMRDAEHAADDATHEILRTVNSTFVTPFDRADIYELASRLDDVMDHMDAAADLVVLYRPEEIPAEVKAQVDVLERAAYLTAEAMRQLRAPQGLTEYWIEINRLENEADRIYRRLLATLFSGMYDPIELLKLKDVVEELEAAADAFEHVAHTVETIAVKDS
jgi:predicted phosphate transport protein (TIGR00153 family)